jgi:hypothetical protein
MDPFVNLDQMMDDPDLRPLRWIIIAILTLFAFLNITCTAMFLIYRYMQFVSGFDRPEY